MWWGIRITQPLQWRDNWVSPSRSSSPARHRVSSWYFPLSKCHPWCSERCSGHDGFGVSPCTAHTTGEHMWETMPLYCWSFSFPSLGGIEWVCLLKPWRQQFLNTGMHWFLGNCPCEKRYWMPDVPTECVFVWMYVCESIYTQGWINRRLHTPATTGFSLTWTLSLPFWTHMETVS